MEQKYYWFLIQQCNYLGESFQEFVSTVHPFSIKLKKGEFILNWKEITREEFDLFNSK